MRTSLAICALSGAQLAQAYSSSLSDCEKFAALWSGTCGGTDSDAKYSTSDWHTSGAGAKTLNCSGASDDVFVPETGSKAENYSMFARNCITCRESNGDVLIRYQSNNVPKICYALNASDTGRFAVTQKFDFEVTWN